MCEWFHSTEEENDLLGTAVLPQVDEAVNYMGMLRCDHLEHLERLPSASLGAVGPFAKKDMVAQCEAYRDELVQRMSARELQAWRDHVSDNVAFEWKMLGLGLDKLAHPPTTCFDDRSRDTVARMCTQNGCCAAERLVGCPVEHEGCLQCEALLKRRRETMQQGGRGLFGKPKSAMRAGDLAKEVDAPVVEALRTFIDDGVEGVKAEMEELEVQLTKVKDWQ